ncbi:phosphorylase family protein [Streptomyces sparsogenes]|uniref:phosphorylase family protein n=1 Tax=Streptomyces sparsogenes TaxID=67365 RepID=UPI002480D77A|nr:hypothetical protein [Streptomyces sparsogenes]
MGTAASLQRELRAGEIVVCDRALRDGGVSHHYLGPAPYAMPSSDLTDHLARILRARTTEVRRGAGWSTDAPSLVDRRPRQNSPVTRNALHVALEAALVALGDAARAPQRPGDEALR